MINNKPKPVISPRLIALQIIEEVLEKNIPLKIAINNNEILKKTGKDKALIQEMLYGTLRWYIQLEYILNQLIEKRIKKKDRLLKYLIIIGLYQLMYMRIPSHAVVSETVEICVKINMGWAKGLINAILRRYLRETKNLNSFRFVQRAIEYEFNRQIKILEQGDSVVQETRLYDSNKGVTLTMRSKEEAHDYRYFPEPDLVPVEISDEWIKETMDELPELPEQKRERFVQHYKIPEYDANVLTTSREIADYYEKSVSLYPEPKMISNWIMGELLRELKNYGQKISASPVKPEGLVALLKLINEGTLSAKMAKTVFEEMYQSTKPAIEIVNQKGLAQITDSSAIENLVDEILKLNTDQVEQYKNGKEKVFGFLVGQIMKQSKGQADPSLVNKLLKDRIN